MNRGVTFRRLKLTDEKFQWLWGQLSALGKYTLNDQADTPDVLWDALGKTDSLHFEAVDRMGNVVGYAALQGITEWSAVCHLTFFDLRLRGREKCVFEFMREVVRGLDIQVIHGYTPMSHRASVAWEKRIGFEHVGTIPRSIRRDGKLLDMGVFAFTREAFEEGEVKDGLFHRRCEPDEQTEFHAEGQSTGVIRSVNSWKVFCKPYTTRAATNIWRFLRRWGARSSLSRDDAVVTRGTGN